MRIEVFQSDKGDCLLLTGKDDARILVDGGMRSSYTEHVAPALGRIAREKDELDLVYVSHIDRDHIAGVLQLMEDIVAWRVYEFQRESGNDDFPEPRTPKPPNVKRLWHNAFHDVVRDNDGAIESLLAASAAILEAGGRRERPLAEAKRELAYSVAEGIELSKRARAEQLGISVNEEFGDKLAMVRERPQRIPVETFRLTLLGPFKEDLDALRKEWNRWLRQHGDEVRRIREETARDTGRLVAGDVDGFRAAMALRAGELGDRDRVTVSNLASLTFLAEESGRTLLLTGDAHGDEIVRGLREAGRLDGGKVHVDVLKIQHHGSEHNIDEEFCRKVSADHYLFCANGEHDNPDPRVVELVARSRKDDRRFKLWFNSSSKASATERGRAHMKEVEALAARLANSSGGKLGYRFLNGHSLVVR